MLSQEILESSRYFVVFDSCVKRFEVLLEYTWKMFKIAAEFQGKDAPGPRPAILEALRFGWIENPQFWSEALEARNNSVHDYFGISYARYVQIMQSMISQLPDVFQKIKDSAIEL